MMEVKIPNLLDLDPKAFDAQTFLADDANRNPNADSVKNTAPVRSGQPRGV
jgi:hypothetical protein